MLLLYGQNIIIIIIFYYRTKYYIIFMYTVCMLYDIIENAQIIEINMHDDHKS